MTEFCVRRKAVASEQTQAQTLHLPAVHDADLHVLYVVDESVVTGYPDEEYLEDPVHGHEEQSSNELPRRPRV